MRPVEVRDDRIVLERLVPVRPNGDAARALGAALAATHRAGAGWFGCPPEGWVGDGYIGDARLPHVPAAGHDDAASWGRFFARCRLTPFLEGAARSGTLDTTTARAVRAVCARLEDVDDALGGPPEPVARLHGDLWAGNVVWTAGGAVLIDPAAHGGHRESDLAMLALFGAPYLPDLVTAYEAVWPLAAGWRDRVPLHQLHPLLVHAQLFGRRYAGPVRAAAEQCLD